MPQRWWSFFPEWKSPSQKFTRCTTSLLWNAQNRQIHSNRKQVSNCKGRGERKLGSECWWYGVFLSSWKCTDCGDGCKASMNTLKTSELYALKKHKGRDWLSKPWLLGLVLISISSQILGSKFLSPSPAPTHKGKQNLKKIKNLVVNFHTSYKAQNNFKYENSFGKRFLKIWVLPLFLKC